MSDFLMDNLRLIPGAVVASFIVLGLVRVTSLLVPAIPRWRARRTYELAAQLSETQYSWWLVGRIVRSAANAVLFGTMSIALGSVVGWDEKLRVSWPTVAFMLSATVMNFSLLDVLLQGRKMQSYIGRYGSYLARLKRIGEVEFPLLETDGVSVPMEPASHLGTSGRFRGRERSAVETDD